MRDHPSETRITLTQLEDKWHKFKRHYYKEMKMHNNMGDIQYPNEFGST